MPYADSAAAYWALLGPDVELRRTAYDVEAICARIRASGIPDAGRVRRRAAAAARRRRGDEFFERMATRRGSVYAGARRAQTPYSAAPQVSRCCLTSARNCAA